ncbi:MAG TPA: hypothetical protein VNY10_22130 [Roseiarcus sp.]|nr:hypothetical protein [Roseiarcus sp.]
MRIKLIVTTAALLGLAAPAHAQLFTPDGAYTVTSGGTPGVGGSDAATLTPGSAMTLTNAGLTLTVSMVAGTDRPGSEWLVFQYTSDGRSRRAKATGRSTQSACPRTSRCS